VGGQYRLTKQAAIDFGYAHLFVRDASVNLCNAAQAAANPPACSGKNNLVGNFKNNVNIVSAQFRYAF
jgi:long-chain fatty acid transport protein